MPRPKKTTEDLLTTPDAALDQQKAGLDVDVKVKKTKPNRIEVFEAEDGTWYYEVGLSNNPNRVIAFSPPFARKGNALNAAKKLADALQGQTTVSLAGRD